MALVRRRLQFSKKHVILTFLMTILPGGFAQEGDCQQISSCKCIYADGAVIDLTPLASQGDPKYKDQPDEGGRELYSWNPCTDFTEDGCNAVAACAIQPSLPHPTYISLGDQDSAAFTIDSGSLYLAYSGEKKGVLSVAQVKLTCADGADTLIVNGPSTEGNVYGFELQSPHACAQSGTGSTERGLSGGSILLIAFGSALFVFFAAGIPIQKFARKQSGKDVVPLSVFWCTLPGLIKDGIVFLVAKIRKKSSYDKI